MAVAGTGGELAICMNLIYTSHPQDKFNKTNPWKICNQNLGSVSKHSTPFSCLAVIDFTGKLYGCRKSQRKWEKLASGDNW